MGAWSWLLMPFLCCYVESVMAGSGAAMRRSACCAICFSCHQDRDIATDSSATESRIKYPVPKMDR
ncbi:hypothetical protein N656DRAFT_782183 [Canariomyces notabilis]|uniref:Secreted protein n=1 Tax=Canariomyces notabilis TaxID=2074819 RepID=A0AAN6TAP5_9PEZI|nr:hypothetical protein N656DRAFT_782183 [Canariomyces arenarius]